MHLKDHWESYCSQHGSILFFPLKLLSLCWCFWHRIKNERKSCWSGSGVISMLLPSYMLYNHRMQLVTDAGWCYDIKSQRYFFGYSEICGVNFLNVLLAQHLSSRFSLLFLRLNLLKQCLPTKGNEKKQTGGFRSYYSLMQLKPCSHKDQLFWARFRWDP